ncbi:hypothetical protein [Sulfuracidifex tepidarius]|uniref:Uncharacterized protein n=1 Tax=Sulfuracidifex tepidarius TaxID=1294262 RepID=A0A510E3K9_9CREN|nr:hypothetical protein [Sulfuracidifex tepidarius]BBG24338.1 hypothetical protein IC006_1648 [Sulfuracidifex tepidarius]BBG27095.1 hypothetical protein IC007_1625 [Sulfuracidifex tepidarius]
MGYICKTAKLLIIFGIILIIVAAFSSPKIGNYAYFSLLGGTILMIISTKYDIERRKKDTKKRKKKVKRHASR